VFSSDAEAFAAAEATYRAYVDALNDVDLSDPATFEPVFALTTGEANAGARKSFSQMHSDGWVVSGESTVSSITPYATDRDTTDALRTVDVIACLDVSAVTLVDAAGESVVDPSRPDVQTVRVQAVPDTQSAIGLLIQTLDGHEGTECE
jgi:hypothetical protein